MALPNFQINPYVKPYVGGISQDFAKVIESKTNQYYQNAEADDVLGYQADTLRNHIAPFENDQLLAGQALDQTRSELQDRAKRGDYENMFREVKRSARKFSSTVEPLLQNKAAYDAYLKTLQEQITSGKVGKDTSEGALKHSIDIYKGYNPKDPNSFFKGYIPTKDESASDILNKFFGDSFKGDKKVTEYLDPISGQKVKTTIESSELPAKTLSGQKISIDENGQYNIDGKGRVISQIELAGRQHLQGNKDFQNYLTTQNTIGRLPKVNQEINGALQAEAQKLGYNINMQEVDILPASWLKWWEDKATQNADFESAAEVPSTNKLLKPEFQGFTFSPQGKIQQGNAYLSPNSDGTYNKYFDKDGKPLTIAHAVAKTTALGNTGIGQTDITKMQQALGIKVEKATPEEQAQLDKVNNEKFDHLVQDSYLAKRGLLNATPAERQAYLSANTNSWNSPQFRKQVIDTYNKAVEDFKTVETNLWTKKNFATIKEIGDMYVPAGPSSNSVLAKNLAGRTMAVLSTSGDLKINTEGIQDINAILSKANEEGWQFEKQTDNGLLKANPSMNIPASSVTLQFTKGETGKRQTAYINVAVGIGEADKKPMLQTLQNVGSAYLSGNGGVVSVPGMGKGGFKVINIPGQVTGVDRPFVGKVQKLDSNGNPYDDLMTIEEFQDWFINLPSVKTEANSFLLNKQ